MAEVDASCRRPKQGEENQREAAPEAEQVEQRHRTALRSGAAATADFVDDDQERCNGRVALAFDVEVGRALAAAGALREIERRLDRPERANHDAEPAGRFRRSASLNKCSPDGTGQLRNALL